MKKKDKEQAKPGDPEFQVEQTIGSMNIEGIRVPDDEKEVLKMIAEGKLDADEIADAIARQALEQSSKENKDK
ncbi:Uncharacterised protein [BD1-7 clade bacterium]|uniref:Antitoxin VbhA domain-containing protein n=1 Tax=BD1-7 clade bacterium TaxID=2029982 RepID=A0A5S9QUB8_9GAMM|nr:Uncharacterised protein [BD1-7 clade bacterium]